MALKSLTSRHLAPFSQDRVFSHARCRTVLPRHREHREHREKPDEARSPVGIEGCGVGFHPSSLRPAGAAHVSPQRTQSRRRAEPTPPKQPWLRRPGAALRRPAKAGSQSPAAYPRPLSPARSRARSHSEAPRSSRSEGGRATWRSVRLNAMIRVPLTHVKCIEGAGRASPGGRGRSCWTEPRETPRPGSAPCAWCGASRPVRLRAPTPRTRARPGYGVAQPLAVSGRLLSSPGAATALGADPVL